MSADNKFNVMSAKETLEASSRSFDKRYEIIMDRASRDIQNASVTGQTRCDTALGDPYNPVTQKAIEFLRSMGYGVFNTDRKSGESCIWIVDWTDGTDPK